MAVLARNGKEAMHYISISTISPLSEIFGIPCSTVSVELQLIALQ